MRMDSYRYIKGILIEEKPRSYILLMRRYRKTDRFISALRHPMSPSESLQLALVFPKIIPYLPDPLEIHFLVHRPSWLHPHFTRIKTYWGACSIRQIMHKKPRLSCHYLNQIKTIWSCPGYARGRDWDPSTERPVYAGKISRNKPRPSCTFLHPPSKFTEVHMLRKVSWNNSIKC